MNLERPLRTDLGHGAFGIEYQKPVSALQGQKVDRRPAKDDFLGPVPGEIQAGNRGSERPVNRRGSDGNVQPPVIRVKTHAEHMGNNAQVAYSFFQDVLNQIHHIDFPVSPAGDKKQLSLRINGRGIVAIGGNLYLPDMAPISE